VDKILERNPAGALSIRAWRSPESVPRAFTWYIEGSRLANAEL
jgi:hypothetical protein